MKLYRETGSTIQTQNILHNELKHETYLTKRHRGTLPNSTWTDAPCRKTQWYFTKQIMDRHMKNIYRYSTWTDAPYRKTIVFHQTDHGQTHENIYGHSTDVPYRKTQ